MGPFGSGGGGASLYLVGVSLDNLEIVCFIGVGFPCCTGLYCAVYVLGFFILFLEDGN